MEYFPLHPPLLRESWLVSFFTLRWIICLNLARNLAWADEHWKSSLQNERKVKQKVKNFECSVLCNSFLCIKTFLTRKAFSLICAVEIAKQVAYSCTKKTFFETKRKFFMCVNTCNAKKGIAEKQSFVICFVFSFFLVNRNFATKSVETN